MSTIDLREGKTYEVNLSYEPYSNDPEYLADNRDFIRSLDFRGVRRVLDLACGVATLSKLLLEVRPEMSIVGLDLSHGGLTIARDHLREAGVYRSVADHGAPGAGHGQMSLLTGTADSLPLADDSVDAVLMGHSIHMLPDEDKLLSEIARVLRPGGLFVFNSSFYAGTFAPGTEAVYHDWTARALEYIREKDKQLRAEGKPGIRRVRGSVPGAFSKPWPTPEQWLERLERQGFDAKTQIRTSMLTQSSFEAIGSYAGFAKVILSGYPVEVSCEALQVAAGPTFRAAGVEKIPRYWLEAIAHKR